ncbi:AAA ATPase forming ring-shaped complexe [Cucumispora dikerogammari]|nr:AAA ATPase forming ring-shaped complexe [Cucumispora dikerogammari]
MLEDKSDSKKDTLSPINKENTLKEHKAVINDTDNLLDKMETSKCKSTLTDKMENIMVENGNFIENFEGGHNKIEVKSYKTTEPTLEIVEYSEDLEQERTGYGEREANKHQNAALVSDQTRTNRYKAESDKKNSQVNSNNQINWVWNIRTLIVSTLLFATSLFFCFPPGIEEMLPKFITDVPEFDIVNPAFYKGIVSYYKNEDIYNSINDAHGVFKEITDLVKKGNPDINQLQRLNPRRNLLISGKPGIGKTYCVKHTIGELFGTKDKSENWKCIEIKPDVLLDKVCGKSEQILLKMFKKIKEDTTTKYIIVFDECDEIITFLGRINYHSGLFNRRQRPHNFGGPLFSNILTGLFLNLIGGNDKIMETPFISIFITNQPINEIGMRVKLRFHIVNPQLTLENIIEVIENYIKDTGNELKISLDEAQKKEIAEIMEELSVQRIIEVLNEYVEESRNSEPSKDTGAAKGEYDIFKDSVIEKTAKKVLRAKKSAAE